MKGGTAPISTAGYEGVEDDVQGLCATGGSVAAGVTDCWKEEATAKQEEG